jgi:23S rRNA (adenine2503-C2)-methyltransferase
MVEPLQISIHDIRAVNKLWRQSGWDPQPLKRLRYLLYGECRPVEDVLAELPAPVRQALKEHVVLYPLSLSAAYRSRMDHSCKLVLRTADGLPIETVLMRSASGRLSVCLSSQVGCAARCLFCATARMGLLRNLSCGEILAQLVEVNRWLQVTQRMVRNVVFMGMGEPFHNYDAVAEAVTAIIDPRMFGISPRRVIVSTVGIPDAMLQFAQRFPTVGLALSLHSTRQEQRQQWMPLARRYPLDCLRETLQRVNRLQHRPVMIEYLLVEGQNDTPEDAQRLVEFLRGLWVHVNLIPYNPIDDGPEGFRATPREQRDLFARMVRQAGFLTTIRYSQGSDIRAACGQLVQLPAQLLQS